LNALDRLLETLDTLGGWHPAGEDLEAWRAQLLFQRAAPKIVVVRRIGRGTSKRGRHASHRVWGVSGPGLSEPPAYGLHDTSEDFALLARRCVELVGTPRPCVGHRRINASRKPRIAAGFSRETW
jgi:hypothetical protein